MPSYTPRELEAIVEARAQELGTAAYLTNRRHQRLREMWCAARFGTGYSRHFSACTLEVEPEDEQRDYDFHLHIPEGRLPFQITEVLDEGRRRGDEYRTTSKDEVAKLLDQRPWQSDMYASQRVCEELQSKIAKRYAEPETLHMLLYLNLKASSVSWASLAGPAENQARVFASVWLVTQDLFCCIHSGKVWSGLVGWRGIEGES